VPIYEYQCSACDHKFEVIQKVSDGLLTCCPKCNEQKLRKLVTAAAFRLKGSGWYETDFKDKKPEKAAGDSGKVGEGASDKGSSGSGADKKNESTPATSEKSAAVASPGSTAATTTAKPPAD